MTLSGYAKIRKFIVSIILACAIALILLVSCGVPSAAAKVCGWTYVGLVVYHGSSYHKYASNCYNNVYKLVPTVRVRGW